jgi:tape measure domain-containing protein
LSIDQKIVNVDLDANGFEKGVDKTTKSIDKLNSSLKFPDAGKGLEEIDKAIQRVDLGRIAHGVEDLSGKFNVLRVTGIAALSSIAINAVESGARMLKGFTIQPIQQGFQEYATNLNAIQTILANTQASGATLKDVNAALLDLNKYSDKTIYNFSQMAKNIGTFTAAGVDLKTSTASIKGIANLAALSGSNAQQASTAMYQLSQAIAAGQVHLQDWNSVVNAGMGGTVFQRALATTAVSMGKLKDGSLKLVGPMKNVSIAGQSFRQSIQAGPGKTSWLTSDVLTRTLGQFTGDLTDAQLKAQGFNDAQIKAIQQTAKTAQHAATEVKTISQVFDVAKETAGSGWAQTFQIIFGNFSQAKKTFTDLSNTINGFINTNAKARNNVLKDWAALGGRANLIYDIQTAFKNLLQIIQPIRRAFRDVFPAVTGRNLYNITLQFERLAEALKPSPTTMQNLRRTFRGLFAVLDIGRQLIVGVVHGFETLFKSVGGGGGGFLHLTANVGDFLVKLDKAIKAGGGFTKFFDSLATVVAKPINLILRLGHAIAGVFSGFSSRGISRATGGIANSFSPIEKAIDNVTHAWHRFTHAVSSTSVKSIFQNTLQGIADLFKELGPAIVDVLKNINVTAITQVLRTGLLAGIFVVIRNFLTGRNVFGAQFKGQIFGGIFSNIGQGLNALSGSMQAMQTQIKAKTVKEIAISIALLAASTLALSLVDPKRLNSALGTMTIMFVELLGALKVLTTLTTTIGSAKIAVMAVALIALAAAIDILVIGVLALSTMNWDELKRGLTGLAGVLGIVVIASNAMNPSGMIRSGIGITAMAVGMNLMALAIRQMGSMNLSELAKGLVAIAISLQLIIDTMNLLPEKNVGMIRAGLGIAAIGVGLNVLATAIRNFGSIDLKVMAKGMGEITVALYILAKTTELMPEKNMIATGAGLLLVSFAMQKLADAISVMGGMSIKELGKGILGLGLALSVLSDVMYGMTESLAGAAALGVAAVGIALLVPALVSLGKQSPVQLATSLIALGLAFKVISASAAAMGEAAGPLLAFGAAITLVGAGFALIGAGVALLGIGLASIAVAGPAAVAILIHALIDLTKALPEILQNIVLALVAMVEAISKTAPQFVNALIKILDSLLKVIIKATPQIGKAIEVLVTTMLKVLRDKAPDLIQTGIDLIVSLLKGIRDNIKGVVKVAAEVIINFLAGLGSQVKNIIQAGVSLIKHLITGIFRGILKLIDAGARAIVTFLNGLADAIDKYEPQIIKAGFRISTAIIAGMIKGIVGGVGPLFKHIKDLGHKMIDAMKHPWKMFSPSKVAEGMGQNIVQGLTNGITKNSHQSVDASHKLGADTVNGLANGIKHNSDKPTKASHKVGKDTAKAVQENFNPVIMQKVGRDAIAGFAKGIHGSTTDIGNAFHDLNKTLLDQITNAKQTIKEEQSKLDEFLKAKHPDLKAIAKAQDAIKKNQAVLAQAKAGHEELTKGLSVEKEVLKTLIRDYEHVSNRLKAANQALIDAKKVRDDAFGQYRDQYETLPSIGPTDSQGRLVIDQVKAYTDSLKDQLKAVSAYHKTLDRLRKLGLDDQTYKKLLEDGTVDQHFADQLLSGGKKAVSGINYLDKQLDKNATSLAKTASTALYQAGVDAAQGLVNGLKQKEGVLSAEIKGLVLTIVKDVKDALKIKSPSQVFAEIGALSMEGMAKGIIDSSRLVTQAAFMVSDDAMGAMRDSLSQISQTITDGIETNPTITPILDLSNIQNGSKTIKGLLAGTSIDGASAISSAQTAAAQESDTAIAAGGVIKFEQNNYSPESLSAVDIYRQTRSQLAAFRSLVNPVPI